MSKEELVAFLKDNLKLDINLDNNRSFTGKRLQVKVSISLGDVKLTESSDYVDIIE